jgi:hypothetical protein
MAVSQEWPDGHARAAWRDDGGLPWFIAGLEVECVLPRAGSRWSTRLWRRGGRAATRGGVDDKIGRPNQAGGVDGVRQHG